MIKYFLLIIAFISLLIGCTRDDICAEGTATTPLLIITFKDSANPTETKEVPNLTVRTSGLNGVVVLSQTTTDSIAIPLNTNLNTSSFLFKKDDGGSAPNDAMLAFTYQREDLYVNRACGFKTIFTNLTTQEEDPNTGNWIVSIETLNPTVANDTSAHLTIFH
ncbi:DUF6452 family protein [Altibacter sp.]|uniref:DUF6452 family protein n=1 Tax=Altibacter sp. TaxID=2024823 RepID=UPI000C8D4D06|nr:DUF6452 family protein [Altibacter sp.]MAP54183.1 hypothetical protein [Altibacter sp.]